MKNYHIPFQAGHLAQGGFEVVNNKLKCRVCSKDFESVNPNAKICEPCRPGVRRIAQRNSKRKKARALKASRTP